MVRSWARVLRLYVLAGALGLAIGVFAVAFLGLVHLVVVLLWERLPEAGWVGGHRALLTIGVCVAGGALVGLINRDAEVHDLEHALDEAESEAPPIRRPVGLARLALLGVISLGFGAALGPEAPLVVLVSGLVSRSRAVLGLARDEATEISVGAALAGVFGGPIAAVAIAAERAPGDRQGWSWQSVGPAIVASSAGLWVVATLLPDGALHPFQVEAWSLGLGARLLIGAVAAVIGAVVAAGLHQALPIAHRTAIAVAPNLLARGVVGGLVLGLAGAAAPTSLFSGHDQMQLLLDGRAAGWEAFALAVLRAVALVACLSTGWFGGEVFPVSAVGMAVAVGLATPFGSQATMVAGVAAMVAAGAGAIRRPLAAFLIYAALLPTAVLPLVGLAVAVAAGVLSAGRASGDAAPDAAEAPA
ncbi:MAG: chloride channel protein [Nocardioidaceae bacterium]|nr:chloride channel protein [Nocardioidaceae bacterium]